MNDVSDLLAEGASPGASANSDLTDETSATQHASQPGLASASMLGSEPFRTFVDQLFDGVYFVDLERRITFWNQAAQRLSGYSAEEVMGRHCSRDLLQHVSHDGTILCEKDCPLVDSMGSRVPVESIVYLRHKNGHRVQVNVRVCPVTDEKGAIAGAVTVFNETGSSRFSTVRNKHLAARGFLDPVTDSPNRRYMEVELFRAMHDFRHHGLAFGAIMFHVDSLQESNAKFGHEASSALLPALARTLTHAIEITDLLGRWSADQFLVLSPGATRQGLTLLAEHCRALVERSEFEIDSERVGATISAGASLVGYDDTLEVFIRRLENLLEHSKYTGRNRVTVG